VSDVSPNRPYPTLLFAGDVYCDLVFAGADLPERGAEVYAKHFAIGAGGVANRAVASARAGIATKIFGRIGDDLLGEYVRYQLVSEPHLELDLLDVVAGRQSPVSVAVADGEERSFITFTEPLGQSVLPHDLVGVRAAHLDLSEELPEWMLGLRRSGTKIVGGVGWDGSQQWSPGILQSLEHVDVFVPNAVEAERYTRTSNVLDAAKALGELVPLVIITRGSRGVFALDSSTGETHDVPAFPVKAIDATGAGDVFVATFMAGDIHGWDIPTKLQFASLCAAISVTSIGGALSAPTLEHVRSFVSANCLVGDWSFLPAAADPSR